MGYTVVHPELTATNLFLQLLSTQLKEGNERDLATSRKKNCTRRRSMYSKKINFLQAFFSHYSLKKVNDIELD
jgi:hypothetical protein